MRTLPLLSLLGTGLLATACGGSATDVIASAALYAVNGARNAAVFPGDTVTWAGYGFGSEQGSGSVVVTTSDGLATATVTAWRDAEVRAVIPDNVQSGPTVLLTASDSLGPLDLFVRPRTTYDPSGHAWTAGAPLPASLAGTAVGGVRFPAAGALSTILVATGGARPDGTFNRTTYLGLVDPAGRVTEWREAPDTIIPAGRRLHAMVGADRTNAVLENVEGVAYMIGGLDSADRVLSDVLGLGLGADGSYGLWTALPPLPDNRAGAAALAAYSKLYVIGGFGSDSLASRSVAYATILPSGTPNGWLLGPPLPEGRAFAAAVVIGSTLFVLGGERGLIDPDTVADSTQLAETVYAIAISPLTGAFRDTTWTALPVTLPQGRSRAAAFGVDDVLIVTGGVYPGMPSSAETEYATLVGGLPEAFQEFPGATLASMAGGPVWLAAAPVIWDTAGIGRVTLIGGLMAGSPTAQTWSQ